MVIDSSVLVSNANKLDKCINKNEKQDKKDKQLYNIIERKVKKEKHKHLNPEVGKDGTLRECKRWFKKGASPEVLTEVLIKLKKSPEYYEYYTQHFLPALKEEIKQSKKLEKIKKEKIEQVISEITDNSKYCSNSITHNQNDRRNSEAESGYGSDVEDDHKVEISNEITNNNTLLLKAIKNGNNRKFKKYLDEKGNNILHLIASFKKEQKCNFLDILIKTETKENLAQLINSENKEGKTPFQVALINKITKEKHESSTTRNSDNTLKFLAKLLKYGAKLSLPTEDLEKLSKKQNEYYLKFLEKLAERKPEIKTKVEEVIAHTINTPDSNDNYQLHLAIKDNDKERFEELLQKGADISLKDTDGNNALHLIVLELKQKRKFEFSNIILNVSKEEEKEYLKAQFKKAINAENTAKQTPLHQLFQHIKEKNENRSCTDKKFEKTNRYKALELFLQNGADITAQDKEGNNILHHIASLKGEQKVACLELISSLVKERKISEDKLDEAIKATNRQGNTPLELALKKKAEKKSIEYLSQETIFDLATNYDNTTKFCAALLQNGANPDSLWLEDPEFHTKKYYLTLRDLKDCSNTPQKAQEKAKELKEKLEEKYHCGTASKKCQSGIKKLGSGVKKGASAAWKCIDPGRRASVLLAITVATTIITMVTLSCFQGQIAIGAALPIIAITGVACLIFTLGLSGIRKSVKELTNDKQSRKDDHLAAKQPENITEQQNLANNSAEQEVQRSSNQSEHKESPATQMSYVSILRQFINKPDGLTNKFSFPGR